MTTAAPHRIAAEAVARARFVVVGLGGLGCPAVLGLVAAGARRFVLVDDDRVDASNLHRQVLYTTADVGAPKVEAATRHVRARAPTAELRAQTVRLDETTRGPFFAALEPDDVVLECTDSPSSKFAINDLVVGAATEGPTRAVIGGVVGFSGQAIAVRSDGPGACYRCLFETPPPRDLAPACADVGVLGAAAGAIGWWMAVLACALARDAAEASGHLIALDVRDLAPRRLAPAPRRDCPACDGLRRAS